MLAQVLVQVSKQVLQQATISKLSPGKPAKEVVRLTRATRSHALTSQALTLRSGKVRAVYAYRNVLVHVDFVHAVCWQ